MTVYELNTLIILSGETSGRMVEFWVSVSFAVVVASFFISKQLNTVIFRIMGFLYLLSSLFFASIYAGSALRANFYFSQLVALGADVSHLANPVSFSSLVMVVVLFVGGTGSTLYYMRYCEKLSAVDDEGT